MQRDVKRIVGEQELEIAHVAVLVVIRGAKEYELQDEQREARVNPAAFNKGRRFV